MAVYAVGDIQGCALPLEGLLERLRFDADRDVVWLVGDLINRGPDSLAALRLVKGLGPSARVVLGNHDLHFLAVYEGIRCARPGDTLKKLLKAPDIDKLAHWLRHQPLVYADRKLQTLMVHAGVYPGWRWRQLMQYAKEVEHILQGNKYRKLLQAMYGPRPARWRQDLTGYDRYRFIINALTRMRYISARGSLNLTEKGAPGEVPEKWMPWFDHPDRRCRKWRIVFGHWSALGYFQRKNLISLDSGCVWGGKLTAVRLDQAGVSPYWQFDCP